MQFIVAEVDTVGEDVVQAAGENISKYSFRQSFLKSWNETAAFVRPTGLTGYVKCS